MRSTREASGFRSAWTGSSCDLDYWLVFGTAQMTVYRSVQGPEELPMQTGIRALSSALALLLVGSSLALLRPPSAASAPPPKASPAATPPAVVTTTTTTTNGATNGATNGLAHA